MYYIEDENGKILVTGETLEEVESTQNIAPALQGMEIKEGDLVIGYDGNYYVLGFEPQEPEPIPPTSEEISEMRKEYRKANIDDLTSRMVRKKELGEWTDEDEAEYIATAKAVEEYIEANFPYPDEMAT